MLRPALAIRFLEEREGEARAARSENLKRKIGRDLRDPFPTRAVSVIETEL